MAILKHISSKNANYGDAEKYLTFEHDEFTMKPTLDADGRLIPRADYRISSLNCGGEDFAVACMRSNLRYGKNQKREDVKSHHYIISFDPRDGPDNGLTVDRAQELGEKFCAEHFPGHQALVCTHPDGHSHTENVDIHNRLVCFDIKELGTQLRKLGMLIVQDQVWNRVTINRSEGKATRYYIDEFHLLLKEEQTAAYSVEIWKRFRKWGGIPTGITQNVKDLLSSREVENIFENSDFVYMLNQAQGDREILAKQLNISQQQMTYVTHSDAGEGLIFYGNVILPFIDRFPQDTELYRVMTTKPGEVSA